MSRKDFASDFLNICKSQKDSIAFIVKHDIEPIEITYKKLLNLIMHTKLFLDKNFHHKKRRIATILPNSIEQSILFLSSTLSDSEFAPLPCTGTEEELLNYIGILNPSLLIASDLLDESVFNKIKELDIKIIIIKANGKFGWNNAPPTIKTDFSSKDSKLLISTSGTTGNPKFIVQKIQKLWDSAKNFNNFHGINNKKYRYWNFLPMSYLGGIFNLLLIPLSSKGSVLIDDPFNGASLLSFWRDFERYQINAMWIVPTIARGLIKFSTRIDSKLIAICKKRCQIAFVGTAPITSEEKQSFKNIFGIRLLENYGLTETTFISSDSCKREAECNSKGVGYIMPTVDIKLDQNSIQSELRVKTPYLFLGYLNESGLIEKPSLNDGYFPTGDIAAYNEKSKSLFINARKKEIIKKGGFLINLKEIELLVLKEVFVSEAAAIPVIHDFYGESYILFLEFKNKSESESIRLSTEKRIHERLDKYKWPDQIIYIKDMPRSPSGKIQKHLLKKY